MSPWKKWVSRSALQRVLVVLSILFLAARLTANTAPENISYAVTLLAWPIGGALVLTLALYWFRIDEAAREAQKWAWYWGGPAGFLILLVLFIIGVGDGLVERVFAGPNAVTPRLQGAMAGFLAQIAGFIFAWTAWWIKKR